MLSATVLISALSVKLNEHSKEDHSNQKDFSFFSEILS